MKGARQVNPMSTIFVGGKVPRHLRHDTADNAAGLTGFLALLVLLTACGEGTPGEQSTTTEGAVAPSTASSVPTDQTATTGVTAVPGPAIFTEDTPTGRYTMRLGDSSLLRLPPTVPWPEAEGSSVEMIEVAYFTDPGYQEWELAAIGEGETSIVVELDTGPLTWTLVVIG